MIKYCRDKWGQNCDKLEQFFRSIEHLGEYTYQDILMYTVKYILDDGECSAPFGHGWDYLKIHTIDDGESQGTLMFLIPRANRYQPTEYDYLLTYISYGSCGLCDTLQSIQIDYDYAKTKEKKEQAIKNLMKLSCDMVNNMIIPYNMGWRERQEYKQVEWEED